MLSTVLPLHYSCCMKTPTLPRFDTITEREKGLHRRLSSGQLSMIAIGGAIGTGLFLGSGFAIGFAGPAVLLSYAIGAVIDRKSVV